MGNDINSFAPALPALVLWPAALAFFCLMAFVTWRLPSVAGRFIVAAFAIRLAASAFHSITFQSSPLGLTWNALISVALVGLGLLVIRASRLKLAAMLPVYLLVMLILASGLINREFAGMADMLVKYILLVVLMLATHDALKEAGAERFFKALLWVFALPLSLQCLSVILGVAKTDGPDGAISFIGGYNHEAAFSLVLVSALAVTCLTPRMNGLLKATLVAAFSAGIVLANYRTSILGALPLLAVVIATGGTRRFTPRQRPLIAGVMIGVVAVAGMFAATFGEERFSDLAVAAQQGTQIIQPPGDFSVEERRLLSGRPYIWSEYLYAFAEGSQLQHLLGFGPNSWADRFRLYAHNTLISTLWELGTLGVAALVLLWTWMLVLAILIRDGPRLRIVAAQLGFILLSFATMPMWMVEGLMLYAVICGYTIACAYRLGDARDTYVVPDLNRLSVGKIGSENPATGFLPRKMT
jgi:hypothetical protein